jgi:hypothetical protein
MQLSTSIVSAVTLAALAMILGGCSGANPALPVVGSQTMSPDPVRAAALPVGSQTMRPYPARARSLPTPSAEGSPNNRMSPDPVSQKRCC